MVGFCIAMVGCNEESKRLLKSPAISDIGVFDGCQVKFIDRGNESRSFYIARCESTHTTTNNYTENVGKYPVIRHKMAIAKEIESLEAEKVVAILKEGAMAKLTPEEKILLGL